MLPCIFSQFAYSIPINRHQELITVMQGARIRSPLNYINWFNREEKSLRHVAMVAKFVDDNKAKTSLKKCGIRTASNFIDLIQFHLIWQMLAKFSKVESERTVSKFGRGKRQLLCCVHRLHKASV